MQPNEPPETRYLHLCANCAQETRPRLNAVAFRMLFGGFEALSDLSSDEETGQGSASSSRPPLPMPLSQMRNRQQGRADESDAEDEGSEESRDYKRPRH